MAGRRLAAVGAPRRVAAVGSAGVHMAALCSQDKHGRAFHWLARSGRAADAAEAAREPRAAAGGPRGRAAHQAAAAAALAALKQRLQQLAQLRGRRPLVLGVVVCGRRVCDAGVFGRASVSMWATGGCSLQRALATQRRPDAADAQPRTSAHRSPTCTGRACVGRAAVLGAEGLVQRRQAGGQLGAHPAPQRLVGHCPGLQCERHGQRPCGMVGSSGSRAGRALQSAQRSPPQVHEEPAGPFPARPAAARAPAAPPPPPAPCSPPPTCPSPPAAPSGRRPGWAAAAAPRRRAAAPAAGPRPPPRTPAGAPPPRPGGQARTGACVGIHATSARAPMQQRSLKQEPASHSLPLPFLPSLAWCASSQASPAAASSRLAPSACCTCAALFIRCSAAWPRCL